MFYKEKITSIQKTDRVLEIGPGSTPFHRSDEFLELKYETELEEQKQFGHTGKFVTSKKIHYYNGEKFPFDDLEFDYIICSHVLEHVVDIPFFLSEIFRVSKKGYLEYPNINYDYLVDIKEHINFIKKEKDTIYWIKKKESPLSVFEDIQEVFHEMLKKGHLRTLLKTNPEFFFEGFEWENELKIKKVETISEIIPSKIKIENFSLTNYIEKEISFIDLGKVMFRKVLAKFKR